MTKLKPISNYYEEMQKLIKNIDAQDDKAVKMDFTAGVNKALEMMLKQHSENKKMMFI